MRKTILTIMLVVGFGSNVSAQTYIYNQSGRNGNSGRGVQSTYDVHPAWFGGMTNSYFSGMYGRKGGVHYNAHYDYVDGSRLGNPSDYNSLPVWGGLGQDTTVVRPAPIEPKVIINPFYPVASDK